MNAKRIRAIAKLVLLFGTPVAVVLGLFSCGVYYGAKHRHAITSFEKEWFGLDVTVAPPWPGAEEAEVKPEVPTKPGSESTPARSPSGAEPAKPGTDAPEPRVVPVSDPPPPREPSPDEPAAREPPREPPPTDPIVGEDEPEPRTDPLAGDLAQRLATPVTVRVKVLVDRELMEQQPAWIDHVQRTVSQASTIYDKQFGVQLRLAGVVEWAVATEGMSAEELLEDVRSRPREGADILLGFTNRPLDDHKAGIADTPEPDNPFNGAYGVVYANRGHRNPHLRTLLHEIAHLFGASDITDPEDSDWAAGSWMSYAPVPSNQAPWIDADNRARVLHRKDRPFRPEPEER
jgi:hypothetical protein